MNSCVLGNISSRISVGVRTQDYRTAKVYVMFASVKTVQVDEPALSQFPPSARASEVICSTNVSHYELQVEIGNNPEFHIIDPLQVEMKLLPERLFCRQDVFGDYVQQKIRCKCQPNEFSIFCLKIMTQTFSTFLSKDFFISVKCI